METDYEKMHRVATLDIPDIGYRTWVIYRNFDLDNDTGGMEELKKRFPYDPRNEHIGY